MIFSKNDNDQETDSGFSNSEVIEIPLLHEPSSNLPVVNAELIDSDDLKKAAFHAAIQHKPLEDLTSQLDSYYSKQLALKKENVDLQVTMLEEQLDLIKRKIEEKKSRLEKVPEIHAQLTKDRELLTEELRELESKFRDLIENLGQAHKNLIENRLKEVKEELNSLASIYNEVFEEKLNKEVDLKEAVGKQRKLCEELISKTRAEYDFANEMIAKDYQLGSTKLSASLLVIIGFLATIGAGWFFAIFSDFNSLESQNWVFFSLNNLFNYLSIYVTQYGQVSAAGWMILSLTFILGLISLIIYVCQSFISKMTHDKLDSQFGLNLTSKSTKFFRFKISSNSLLSFWLHFLPWIFVLGVFFVVLAVGQSVGLPSDQIGKLGQHLSSQFIGIVIALLCAGIFFIYSIKVIEPRKREENVVDAKNIWVKNKELVVLVVGVNVLLGLIILGQSFDGLLNKRQALLSIVCFVFLVNLASFILSAGIRQLGLLRLSGETETRLIALSNYRKALSGNKPIQIWIKEERQFQRHFLQIQRELFELIAMKNKSLNQLKRNNISGWLSRGDETPKNVEFKSLSSLNLSKKKEAQFYMLNFPHLAYQIEEIRNIINSKKRDIDNVDIKIREMVNGNSGFHIRLNNELGQQNSMYQKVQLRITEIKSAELNYGKELQEERDIKLWKIQEGYQLGIWTIKNLILNKDGSN